MTRLRLEGTDQLQRLANRLKDAGDRKLRLASARALRGIAKPVGQAVIAGGAEDMPKRGGLSARVARGRVGIRVSMTGRSASVLLLLKDQDADDLRQLDKGWVRHPVHGWRKTWVSQRITPRRFTVAFMNEAPTARRALAEAAQGVLDDVGKGI